MSETDTAGTIEGAPLHAIEGGLSKREQFKQEHLTLSDSKKVIPTHGNLLKILKFDWRLSGLVAYDSFSMKRVMLKSPPPHDHDRQDAPGPYPRLQADEDVTRVLAYLQTWWAPGFKRQAVEECLFLVSRDHEINPPRDWLATLRWDKKPRIRTWLTQTFGVKLDEYHGAISQKFLVAAVRRVRRPGCKFDSMLVLEGNQGIGKSQALEILCGAEWFTDDVPDKLSNKDAAIALTGKWIIEFSEIDQLNRAEVETIKAFITRTTDHYRPPYGRTAIDVPRQCVLAGTTNTEEYLRDATGGRRFWPVRCLSEKSADLHWLRENREQLWAEAAHLEALGAEIWLDDPGLRETAAKEQAERMVEDVWTDRVRVIVVGKSVVTIPEILNEMGLQAKDQGRPAEMRVGVILRRDGWEKKTVWDPTLQKAGKRWFAPIKSAGQAELSYGE